MARVGDDLAGFSILLDQANPTLLVTAWGFWSPEVASRFASTVKEEWLRLPRGASLSVDTCALKPMRDEGQRAFFELLRSLSELRPAHVAFVTASHITKLQLVRLVAESKASGVEWVTRTVTDGRNA